MNRDAGNNRAAFCPSCERFIGPADVCPYCDADSAKAPILRILRRVSLVLAVGGLGLFYLAAVAREVPTTRISSITPMMNFARVQVSGTAQEDAYVRERTGAVDSVTFVLDDGSGELRVVAYKNVARSLKEGKLVPRRGDIAEVTGVLDATADAKPKLRIISAAGVHIKKDGKDAAERGADAK
jgi:cytochrome c-type biogenesis protein CcmE